MVWRREERYWWSLQEGLQLRFLWLESWFSGCHMDYFGGFQFKHISRFKSTLSTYPTPCQYTPGIVLISNWEELNFRFAFSAQYHPFPMNLKLCIFSSLYLVTLQCISAWRHLFSFFLFFPKARTAITAAWNRGFIQILKCLYVYSIISEAWKLSDKVH